MEQLIDKEMAKRDYEKFIQERVSQIAQEKGITKSDVLEKMTRLRERFSFKKGEALTVIAAFCRQRRIQLDGLPKN